MIQSIQVTHMMDSCQEMNPTLHSLTNLSVSESYSAVNPGLLQTCDTQHFDTLYQDSEDKISSTNISHIDHFNINSDNSDNSDIIKDCTRHRIDLHTINSTSTINIDNNNDSDSRGDSLPAQTLYPLDRSISLSSDTSRIQDIAPSHHFRYIAPALDHPSAVSYHQTSQTFESPYVESPYQTRTDVYPHHSLVDQQTEQLHTDSLRDVLFNSNTTRGIANNRKRKISSESEESRSKRAGAADSAIAPADNPPTAIAALKKTRKPFSRRSDSGARFTAAIARTATLLKIPLEHLLQYHPGPKGRCYIRGMSKDGQITSPRVGQNVQWTNELLKFQILASDGKPLPFLIHGKIMGGDFDGLGQFIVYRRNYIGIQVSYTLGSIPDHLSKSLYIDKDGKRHQIKAMGYTLGAIADEAPHKDVHTVQHTPKRDKGPKLKMRTFMISPYNMTATYEPHPDDRIADYPPPGLPIDWKPQDLAETLPFQQIPEPEGKDPQMSYRPNFPAQTAQTFTFERIQFKSATANNGKRRAAQHYYRLELKLQVDIREFENDEPIWVTVKSTMSERIVVRGRSPNHYQNTANKATKGKILDQCNLPPPPPPGQATILPTPFTSCPPELQYHPQPIGYEHHTSNSNNPYPTGYELARVRSQVVPDLISRHHQQPWTTNYPFLASSRPHDPALPSSSQHAYYAEHTPAPPQTFPQRIIGGSGQYTTNVDPQSYMSSYTLPPPTSSSMIANDIIAPHRNDSVVSVSRYGDTEASYVLASTTRPTYGLSQQAHQYTYSPPHPDVMHPSHTHLSSYATEGLK